MQLNVDDKGDHLFQCVWRYRYFACMVHSLAPAFRISIRAVQDDCVLDMLQSLEIPTISKINAGLTSTLACKEYLHT